VLFGSYQDRIGQSWEGKGRGKSVRSIIKELQSGISEVDFCHDIVMSYNI
jgi:hypothetical protein